MQDYDATLKLLLQSETNSVIHHLTGLTVSKWLNIEIPQVQTFRADLLGSTVEGLLVHMELQSTNDPDMALRMAEYALRIFRQFKKIPRQFVLYVGDQSLRMPTSLISADFNFRYALIDIRDLDGAEFLASPRAEDSLLAILCGSHNNVDTVRKILWRIAGLDEPARSAAFAKFLILSGLRRLSPTVEEEARTMPILNDIMDHEVIGPAIREGLQKGLQQGIHQGRHDMLLRLITKRFGTPPNWIEPRLASLTPNELDNLAVRVLDATSIEDLF